MYSQTIYSSARINEMQVVPFKGHYFGAVTDKYSGHRSSFVTVVGRQLSSISRPLM